MNPLRTDMKTRALERAREAPPSYECTYCGEPHATWAALQVNGKGSLCSPECQLAQGIYFAYVNADERVRRIHQEYVETLAGRPVRPAPPPAKLVKWAGAELGLGRAQWMLACREGVPGVGVVKK